MDTENTQNISVSSRRWSVLIFVTCVIALILGLIILNAVRTERARTTGEKLEQSESATGEQLKTKSGFRLKILNTSPIYKNEDIRLGVYANSASTDAVGFDLALSYSKSLSYVGSESKLTGYDIIETTDTPLKKIIITGAKQIGNKKTEVWKDTQIMILTFKAQNTGIATVGFDLSPGSISDTNLFNNQNKDLVTIAIGSTIQIL